MQYSNRSTIYKDTSIKTSSPIKLVVMLYEGAIRFLRQAKEHTIQKDMASKCAAVDRAMAVLHHLQGTLDFDKGGEISFDLDRLYTYIGTRVFDGSANLNIAAFDEAIHLLEVLHSSWDELSRKEQDSSVSSEVVSQQATDGRLRLNV